uniref:Uncharacterized protein n=1 Tax=Anopheles atroparvus TaxID=41427 RepID=A0AAG5DNV9_ANOAO
MLTLEKKGGISEAVRVHKSNKQVGSSSCASLLEKAADVKSVQQKIFQYAKECYEMLLITSGKVKHVNEKEIDLFLPDAYSSHSSDDPITKPRCTCVYVCVRPA